MAAGVLACGLVAAAALFSFAIRANVTNRQMAVATALLYEKMETLRALSFTDPLWATASGSETVVVSGERFIRQWNIDANVPRALTVTVSVQSGALTRRQIELIRATTLLSRTF